MRDYLTFEGVTKMFGHVPVVSESSFSIAQKLPRGVSRPVGVWKNDADAHGRAAWIARPQELFD